MKMFLVCGMPGSGKTHFAQKFAEKNGIIYLNIDKFYEKVNGDECDRSHKFEVWIEFFKAIHEVELAGKDVVIETMALTAYNRKEFTSWFPAFEHHMIYIEAYYYACLNNVKKRERKIPEEVMEKYYKKLETPSMEEYKDWDSAICIINAEHAFWHRKNSMIFKGYNFPIEMLEEIVNN